ncbi:MAG: long-chain fatty acid--CoA ligase [Gemmatimonadales bacterium]|nr:long-chain fatty acid--CoA ligase [Gemmatimonadales bacterium]
MAATARTLNELLFGALDRFGSRPVAMRAKQAGSWIELSYRDVAERIQDLSLGLLAIGVSPGDRVAILSENRPEWAIADYACLTACCTDVPIYPTLPAKQVEHNLSDSGAVAAFVSTRLQLEKLLAVRERLPRLRHIIAFDPDVSGPGVLSLEEVYARGRGVRPERGSWRPDALRVRPEDVATIIYTSGTTGEMKGVMLTHGNITSNVTTCCTLYSFTEHDECLSFLPLSHIFERMFGHYCMLHSGVIINYAESVDTVAADMQQWRPTLMASVPRLYEKIYGRVLDAVRSGSAVKRRIFFWGKRVGEAVVDRRLANRPLSPVLRAQFALADRLVFAKLRARTGGRIRFFISGGAPLSADIARFFHAAGMPILEGYGLTETSPVIAVNTFEHLRLGTVGVPIPGVEVKIAPDGEILTRGPHVMSGYYNKAQATAEALDSERWFHTGDIGMLDPDGFLRITDRKKDIIVTAGGKNISPQPIETLAKTNRFVSNAVMLGDRRPFPIMLVVPNYETLAGWATTEGLLSMDAASLVARPEVRAMMEQEIGTTLRDLAGFEKPKKLLLLARDFSLEAGELTPKLSVKRRVVEQRHAAAIEALYHAPE